MACGECKQKNIVYDTNTTDYVNNLTTIKVTEMASKYEKMKSHFFIVY